jgi:His/Glu/Gln/Arg/opine family amino acid ABC transporter permease subunit
LLASGHLTNYLLLLLKGLAITLQLSLGSLVLGSLAGIVLGAMRNSGWRALKAMAVIYIEAVRSIPFVILLFFVFFAVLLALDIDIPPLPRGNRGAERALFGLYGGGGSLRHRVDPQKGSGRRPPRSDCPITASCGTSYCRRHCG